MELNSILAQITPADRTAYDGCIARFDAIAKPLGSLGRLEHLLATICGVTGTTTLDLTQKAVLVFCADNGVVRQGVSQAGSEVTRAIAGMLAKQQASVCQMAKAAGADVFALDVGMCGDVEGLPSQKTACGTADITEQPAMTRGQMLAAINTGFSLVGQKKANGYALLATGEAGIGNTTTASAMASVLLGLPPAVVTGRGAGLSDEGLLRKQAAIEVAIAINQPDATDPLDVLQTLGGFDIAAMTGVFLGGAYHKIPIVADGVISCVAALTACRLCPTVRDYILESHVSAEPAGRLLCDALGFSPPIQAGLRLGEGTGAVALFALLDMAAAVYNADVTFARIAVPPYEKSPC